MWTEIKVNSVSSNCSTSVFNCVSVSIELQLCSKRKSWSVSSNCSACCCSCSWCRNTCCLPTACCTWAITCYFKSSKTFIFWFRFWRRFLLRLLLFRFLSVFLRLFIVCILIIGFVFILKLVCFFWSFIRIIFRCFQNKCWTSNCFFYNLCINLIIIKTFKFKRISSIFWL